MQGMMFHTGFCQREEFNNTHLPIGCTRHCIYPSIKLGEPLARVHNVAEENIQRGL
jgi:hypothetical protein